MNRETEKGRCSGVGMEKVIHLEWIRLLKVLVGAPI